jgi:hypothetical protein
MPPAEFLDDIALELPDLMHGFLILSTNGGHSRAVIPARGSVKFRRFILARRPNARRSFRKWNKLPAGGRVVIEMAPELADQTPNR